MTAAASMRDFEDSTLWRISAFERLRAETGNSGFSKLGGPSTLSSSLMQDLQHLEFDLGVSDVIEIVAACLRHREPALLYLQHAELVWPVTLFPAQMLYHGPRDLAAAAPLDDLSLIGIEPPGVRPPGHWAHERIALSEHYRPLAPLLWAMALTGPRTTLLGEIGGTAAYRAVPQPATDGAVVPGAIGSALERLRHQSVALRTIAGWPGMSVERAIRLLNALYLTASLVVTRTHHAARSEPGSVRGWFGLRKR